jgi:hypothetical protein
MDRISWMRVLDNYLVNKTLLSEEYEQMDFEQRRIIKEIKLSIKRIGYAPVPKNFINDKYKI